MQKYVLGFIIMFAMQFAWAGTKRALLIGISEYPANNMNSEALWGTIHGTNDVELISPTLKTMGFKVTTLTNSNATAAKIRKALSKLQSETLTGDTIYLHFSCHGQPFEDLDGDEEDGWDEAIIPYDAQMEYEAGKYEGENHILDDELHTYFQKLRNVVGTIGFVCVVIDACHAGNTYMGDEEDEEEAYCRGIKKGFTLQGKDYHPRINAKGHFQIPQESGLADILIIEACRSYQSNYEIKQDGSFYGPLSYYINQELRNGPNSFGIEWVKSIKSMRMQTSA